MKISRKRLRKIINEFLDTSRPMIDQPIPDLKDLTNTSVYDQLTNSERAAFVSAMGIAGDAGIPGTSQDLSEGSVIKGPWTSRKKFDSSNDPDGDITYGELESAGLGNLHNLPPTYQEEEDIQRKITSHASKTRKLSDEDWMHDFEAELEDLMSGIESGEVVKLPSEYDDSY